MTQQVAGEEITGDAQSSSKTYSYDVFGNRIAMQDKKVGSTTPQDYLYAYDVHGSVSMLMNDGGSQAPTVKATYGYDAYGGEDKALTTDSEESSGATGNKDPLNAFRYTAKRYDTGSDSLDMGARRFSPDVGRFMQRDQYLGALSNLGLGSDPLTQNRYSLAGGNPISFIETDGHMVVADGGGTAGKSGGGSSKGAHVDGWAAGATGGSGGGASGGGGSSPADFRAAEEGSDSAGRGLELGVALMDLVAGALQLRSDSVKAAGLERAAEIAARANSPAQSWWLRLPGVADFRRGWLLSQANDVAEDALARSAQIGRIAGAVGRGSFASAFALAAGRRLREDLSDGYTGLERTGRSAVEGTAVAVAGAKGFQVGMSACGRRGKAALICGLGVGAATAFGTEAAVDSILGLIDPFRDDYSRMTQDEKLEYMKYEMQMTGEPVPCC